MSSLQHARPTVHPKTRRQMATMPADVGRAVHQGVEDFVPDNLLSFADRLERAAEDFRAEDATGQWIGRQIAALAREARFLNAATVEAFEDRREAWEQCQHARQDR
jgi:hypothetical protein